MLTTEPSVINVTLINRGAYWIDGAYVMEAC